MKRTSFLRLASLCTSLALLAAAAAKAQVSGNNLTSTALPDYAYTTGPATSESFAIGADGLYSISTTIVSTTTGFNISPYYIAGVSAAASPTSAAELLADVRVGATGGNPYPSTTSSMIFAKTTGASTAFYNLGMGRFDSFGSANYDWSATANTLYGSAGTDGNIAPNASFESIGGDANFFNGPGSVVDGGVQGSKAWQMTSATISYIALPVIEGQEYTMSLWYSGPAGFSKVEYGFSTPLSGFAVAPGNTSISVSPSTLWTERTTTFTPGAGQDTWYIGGMSNGGQLQLDSIYVAAVPEPGTLALCALGLTMTLAFRRRRA